MWCPTCGTTLEVNNTRHKKKTNTVRRTRYCPKCKKGMGSIEILVLGDRVVENMIILPDSSLKNSIAALQNTLNLLKEIQYETVDVLSGDD
jgi:transcriptional regulator NrdR family protein